MCRQGASPLFCSCYVFWAAGSVFVLAEDLHGTVIPTNVVFQLLACDLCSSLDSNWARDRKACGLCGVGPVYPRCDSFESGGCEELSSPRAPFLAIIGPPATLCGASSAAMMLSDSYLGREFVLEFGALCHGLALPQAQHYCSFLDRGMLAPARPRSGWNTPLYWNIGFGGVAPLHQRPLGGVRCARLSSLFA